MLDVEDADEVRVLDGGRRPGLAEEPLPGEGIGRPVRRQHLDRHPPPHGEVLGQVHLAHPAQADPVEQLVLAEDEPLVPAAEQLLGLKRGEEAVILELLGEFGRGRRPPRAGRAARPRGAGSGGSALPGRRSWSARAWVGRVRGNVEGNATQR